MARLLVVLARFLRLQSRLFGFRLKSAPMEMFRPNSHVLCYQRVNEISRVAYTHEGPSMCEIFNVKDSDIVALIWDFRVDASVVSSKRGPLDAFGWDR